MQTVVACLPFPGKIARGAGALEQSGAICRTHGRRLLILGGKTALDQTRGKLAGALGQSGVEVAAEEWYGGEVTRVNILRLAKELGADAILAVGGGKALDTGKAAAAECGLPVITVPTIAATCAAVTPLSVLYNDRGEFAGNLFLPDCPAGVIVDTAIIAAAPAVWLEAGIGDTLAKMYELRAAAVRIDPDSASIAAVANGRICYDIIRRFGREARAAAGSGAGSRAFDSVVDAIILTAGLSSIFGGESLRNAAAHAIYNGFTTIPSTHVVAHGLIVGYGNLCLLALEGRSDEEIKAELRLAADCGIPVRLSQIASMTPAELAGAAQAAACARAMACMPFAVSAEMVIDAIRRVDRLAESI